MTITEDITVAPFFAEDDDLFTRYRATIKFRDQVWAGTPRDPELIEKWIKAKMKIDDEEELQRMVADTLSELGVHGDQSPDYLAVDTAVSEIAKTKHLCVFRRDENGLYFESRCVKAAIKESANIVFEGRKFGAAGKKGAKNFLAERIFVDPDRIYFGKHECDSVERFIGHVIDRTGPKATVGMYETMHKPVLEFEVVALNDCLSPKDWSKLWRHMGWNGMGAVRSQGYGQFDVIDWQSI